jgi:hypothetical protein
MSPVIKKWLRRLGFIALGVWGFYLLAVNLYLNTPLAPLTINRKPEKFQIQWGWGWSLWPGITYLNDIETKGQSRKVQWYAHLDSVMTTYRIAPLFERVVDLRWVRAKGIDYRQRRRVQAGVDPGRDASMDPPIPGFSNPPDPDPQKLYPKKPKKAPWTVLADRIVCDLEQLWIEGYRVEAGWKVDTRMNLVVRGRLEFPGVKLTSDAGKMWVGDEVMFEGFEIDVDARVEPFVPKGKKGPEIMRHISGRFGIDSSAASFRFLEPYFRKAPWLHFNGRGPLKMVLDLDREGRDLVPGQKADRIRVRQGRGGPGEGCSQVQAGILDGRVPGR